MLQPLRVMVSGMLQVNSNLETAERLSETLGNTLLLKREDMQPVRADCQEAV